MISGINHLTWNVTDIDATFGFYVDVLGFVPVMKCDWSAYFLAGDLWIAVVKGESRQDDRYDHIAFHIDGANYAKLVSKLLDLGIKQVEGERNRGRVLLFSGSIG